MHIEVVLVHTQYNFSPYLSLLSDLRLAIHLLLHSEFEAAVAVPGCGVQQYGAR